MIDTKRCRAATACNDTARRRIVTEFAKWTAASAAREGCPVRKPEKVCMLLGTRFDRLWKSKRHIGSDEFDRWHKRRVAAMRARARALGSQLPAGWAAKILNVYLKTFAYIGGYGRPGLLDCVHPPFDGRLVRAMRDEANEALGGSGKQVSPALWAFKTIKSVADYDRDYVPLVREAREIASLLKLQYPFEVESLWSACPLRQLKGRSVPTPPI